MIFSELESVPRVIGGGAMTERDAGRVAVVTGGASGMGLAIAYHLARAGNRVAVVDLDGDAAATAAKEIGAAGGAVTSAAVDVSDRAQVDGALAAVRAEFGPIEIMVTSAGFDRFE